MVSKLNLLKKMKRDIVERSFGAWGLRERAALNTRERSRTLNKGLKDKSARKLRAK